MSASRVPGPHHGGPTTRWGALGAALVTTVAWGMTGVFVRLLPQISPTTVVAGRLLVALAVTLPLLGARTQRPAFRAVLRDPVAWVLSAVMVGYYVASVAAFQWAPVAEVALLIGTAPLFVLGYRWLRRLPVHRHEAMGALLAVLGVATILLPGLTIGAPGTRARAAGDGLALLAAAAAAAYATLYRTRAERGSAPPSVALALLTFTLGGAGLLVWTLTVAGGPGAAPWTGRTALVLLGLGVVSTAVPTLGYAIAAGRLPAVVTTATGLLTPVFAAVFAALLLHERPSPWVVPGGMLVLCGLFLVVRPRT